VSKIPSYKDYPLDGIFDQEDECSGMNDSFFGQQSNSIKQSNTKPQYYNQLQIKEMRLLPLANNPTLIPLSPKLDLIKITTKNPEHLFTETTDVVRSSTRG
jgi:hypothetical protein